MRRKGNGSCGKEEKKDEGKMDANGWWTKVAKGKRFYAYGKRRRQCM